MGLPMQWSSCLAQWKVNKRTYMTYPTHIASSITVMA